eukprot:511583_1
MVRSNILTGPAPVSHMPYRSLSEKAPYDSHGCSVSCVTLLHSGSAIECCCEDGSVRLFGMSDPGRVAYTKGRPGVGVYASTGSAKDRSPILSIPKSKNNANLNNIILPEFDEMLVLLRKYWIVVNNDLCQKKKKKKKK